MSGSTSSARTQSFVFALVCRFASFRCRFHVAQPRNRLTSRFSFSGPDSPPCDSTSAPSRPLSLRESVVIESATHPISIRERSCTRSATPPLARNAASGISSILSDNLGPSLHPWRQWRTCRKCFAALVVFGANKEAFYQCGWPVVSRHVEVSIVMLGSQFEEEFHERSQRDICVGSTMLDRDHPHLRDALCLSKELLQLQASRPPVTRAAPMEALR
jgi:hypothetical protein